MKGPPDTPLRPLSDAPSTHPRDPRVPICASRSLTLPPPSEFIYSQSARPDSLRNFNNNTTTTQSCLSHKRFFPHHSRRSRCAVDLTSQRGGRIV
ncbi:hypothetical protein Pmani_016660 [Petrolisthes manimaculis]|uniref:Uncharacterized protein n=1 Tax=Petrolisthes manimaculis TaxID=1843537 RepID=A0AAE1PPW7_9EUCA|nr:hypothetical protein Pmani_016660 [Petrolisthes manimaculis]